MRLLALVGIVGIWHAAEALRGSLVVTALVTLACAALAAWAVAVLRER